MKHAIYGNQREALLAYLAGIVDGEGTLVLSKCKIKESWNYSYSSKIRVKMSNHDAIKLFADAFNLNVKEDKPVGAQRKMLYRAEAGGHIRVKKILEELLPYLIVKKKQAETLIKFSENFNSRKHSKLKECRICKEVKEIQGYQLCHNCYMRMRRQGKMNEFNDKKYSTRNDRISSNELKRREDCYLTIRKLNAA